jgi:RNA polymerase sigma-70 factor (ECF subfamily)
MIFFSPDQHFPPLKRLIPWEAEAVELTGIKPTDVGELYERKKAELVRAAARFCGDEELARDGVQQAFLAALSRCEEFSEMPEPAALAWLGAAARNAIIDARRREKRVTYLEELPAAPDGELPRDAEERAILSEAMERLPETQRKLVELRWFAGFNSAEIGKILGMNAATVRYHLARAIEGLRNYYRGE